MPELKHLDEIVEEQESLDDCDSFMPALRKREQGGSSIMDTGIGEMDITPMIDITFLLLIFFLVTSTPDETTAIELPNAQNGAPVSQLSSTIFTIAEGDRDSAPVYNSDGKIDAFLLSEDTDTRKKQIKQAVEDGLLQENKADVIIKADKSVKCREVDRVMKAISKVDGVKLHLAILSD